MSDKFTRFLKHRPRRPSKKQVFVTDELDKRDDGFSMNAEDVLQGSWVVLEKGSLPKPMVIDPLRTVSSKSAAEHVTDSLVEKARTIASGNQFLESLFDSESQHTSLKQKRKVRSHQIRVEALQNVLDRGAKDKQKEKIAKRGRNKWKKAFLKAKGASAARGILSSLRGSKEAARIKLLSKKKQKAEFERREREAIENSIIASDVKSNNEEHRVSRHKKMLEQVDRLKNKFAIENASACLTAAPKLKNSISKILGRFEAISADSVLKTEKAMADKRQAREKMARERAHQQEEMRRQRMAARSHHDPRLAVILNNGVQLNEPAGSNKDINDDNQTARTGRSSVTSISTTMPSPLSNPTLAAAEAHLAAGPASPAALGSHNAKEILIGQQVRVKLRVGQAAYFFLKFRIPSCLLVIDPRSVKGNAHVCVCPNNQFPEPGACTWQCGSRTADTITVHPLRQNFRLGTYFIGVHAIAPRTGAKNASQSGTSAVDKNAGSQICDILIHSRTINVPVMGSLMQLKFKSKLDELKKSMELDRAKADEFYSQVAAIRSIRRKRLQHFQEANRLRLENMRHKKIEDQAKIPLSPAASVAGSESQPIGIRASIPAIGRGSQNTEFRPQQPILWLHSDFKHPKASQSFSAKTPSLSASDKYNSRKHVKSARTVVLPNLAKHAKRSSKHAKTDRSLRVRTRIPGSSIPSLVSPGTQALMDGNLSTSVFGSQVRRGRDVNEDELVRNLKLVQKGKKHRIKDPLDEDTKAKVSRKMRTNRANSKQKNVVRLYENLKGMMDSFGWRQSEEGASVAFVAHNKNVSQFEAVYDEITTFFNKTIFHPSFCSVLREGNCIGCAEAIAAGIASAEEHSVLSHSILDILRVLVPLLTVACANASSMVKLLKGDALLSWNGDPSVREVVSSWSGQDIAECRQFFAKTETHTRDQIVVVQRLVRHWESAVSLASQLEDALRTGMYDKGEEADQEDGSVHSFVSGSPTPGTGESGPRDVPWESYSTNERRSVRHHRTGHGHKGYETHQWRTRGSTQNQEAAEDAGSTSDAESAASSSSNASASFTFRRASRSSRRALLRFQEICVQLGVLIVNSVRSCVISTTPTPDQNLTDRQVLFWDVFSIVTHDRLQRENFEVEEEQGGTHDGSTSIRSASPLESQGSTAHAAQYKSFRPDPVKISGSDSSSQRTPLSSRQKSSTAANLSALIHSPKVASVDAETIREMWSPSKLLAQAAAANEREL